MSIKTLLLLFLLASIQHVYAQKETAVYQYILESDTSLGLIIQRDTLGRVCKESYKGYYYGPYTRTAYQQTVYHFYDEQNIDSALLLLRRKGESIEIIFYQEDLPRVKKSVSKEIDSSITRYYYNERNQLSKKTEINYDRMYEAYYRDNPEWGLVETTYTYEDSVLVRESAIAYYGDGSIRKKRLTKKYTYDGAHCTIHETRHDYPFNNPYRKITHTITYQDSQRTQMLAMKQVNRKNKLVKEEVYQYDEAGRLLSVVYTDGITNDKLWSFYVYSSDK